MQELKRRLYNLMVALDQLIYVLLTLGNGRPNETLSAAAYSLERKGNIIGLIFRPVIDKLFFCHDDHCFNAWLKVQNYYGKR